VIHFAGDGAHHHNGVAERGIQTVMSIARTMMLHAVIHWPDVSDARMWPMAVQHVVNLHNKIPNETTVLSAHDLFTNTRLGTTKIPQPSRVGLPNLRAIVESCPVGRHGHKGQNS
jgi:hypothetical protein